MEISIALSKNIAQHLHLQTAYSHFVSQFYPGAGPDTLTLRSYLTYSLLVLDTIAIK